LAASRTACTAHNAKGAAFTLLRPMKAGASRYGSLGGTSGGSLRPRMIFLFF
jgi:hypothetical protein